MDISIVNIPTKELEEELAKRRSIELAILKTVPKPLPDFQRNSYRLVALMQEAVRLVAIGEEESITVDMAYTLVDAVFAAIYGPAFNEWYVKTAKMMLK